MRIDGDNKDFLPESKRDVSILQRLTEIANECGTDKGTIHGDAQGYTLIYEMLFNSMRDRALNLLEVGLSIGGPEHGIPASRSVHAVPSIATWRAYFPKAKIFGLDISDCSAFETEWFKFYRTDCGAEERLDEVVADLRKAEIALDVIIDDASHASFHQQLTMIKLFPLLKPGGFYVIEDLNWQPHVYEVSLPKVPKTSQLLIDLLQNGRIQVTGSIAEESWRSVAAQIGSALLFDEDYLLHLRRGYNIRSKASAQQPSYLEMSWPKRLFQRRQLRHVYEQARRGIGVCLTGAAPLPAGRVSLAVIQKHLGSYNPSACQHRGGLSDPRGDR